MAVGCEQCGGTGYAGRSVLAEMLVLDNKPLADAVLARGRGPVRRAGTRRRHDRSLDACSRGDRRGPD